MDFVHAETCDMAGVMRGIRRFPAQITGRDPTRYSGAHPGQNAGTSWDAIGWDSGRVTKLPCSFAGAGVMSGGVCWAKWSRYDDTRKFFCVWRCA